MQKPTLDNGENGIWCEVYERKTSNSQQQKLFIPQQRKDLTALRLFKNFPNLRQKVNVASSDQNRHWKLKDAKTGFLLEFLTS